MMHEKEYAFIFVNFMFAMQIERSQGVMLMQKSARSTHGAHTHTHARTQARTCGWTKARKKRGAGTRCKFTSRMY